MNTTIIMRSHNDMPLTAETLKMIYKQEHPFDLIAFDNASTDGSIYEILKYTDKVINIPEKEYIPGKILNRGIELSESEFIVFVNSDCTPQNEKWLGNLLAGFNDSNVAAVFGRQVARPDCSILFSKDIEDTYGDGSRQKKWRHCFSMASSAIRRSVWESLKFNEEIRYSEDIDWTWRARQNGHKIRYVDDSIAAHSHNYSLYQFYKRHFGEGKAEAGIFDWLPWESSLLRYSILPYLRQIAGDWKHCLSNYAIGCMAYSPVLRMAQLIGRRAGFRKGMKGRRRNR